MKQVTRLIDKLPKHNSSDFVAILGRVELEVKADTRLKQIYVQGRADADLGKHVFAPLCVSVISQWQIVSLKLEYISL
ncbi:hypothetical protein [Vibrio splendidus]|uniref:hypothetical protein n=1 Tax=Vibrio splendidus TaxID=29497 RepID=UPI000C8641AF|nr:hypothetical protein [Vibrio splendidus]PMI27879.1 hypothetical protein BCU48_17805 [Vibrio splendidus]